jgi:hypothetical protein
MSIGFGNYFYGNYSVNISVPPSPWIAMRYVCPDDYRLFGAVVDATARSIPVAHSPAVPQRKDGGRSVKLPPPYLPVLGFMARRNPESIAHDFHANCGIASPSHRIGRVALNGVDRCVVVGAFDNAYMITHAVALPIEKGIITVRGGVIAPLPTVAHSTR